MRQVRHVFVVLLAVAAGSGASGQTAPATPPAAAPALVPSAPAAPAPAAPAPACAAAAHRQFDFWLGTWDVRTADGKTVGRNRIEASDGGCVLVERWQGNGGVTGTSLNAFDATRGRWHQTWVDNGGGVLQLDGGLVDGRMQLEGDAPPERGAPAKRQRIVWTPLPDGRVRQLWESSADGGKTWTTEFDGYYTRRAP